MSKIYFISDTHFCHLNCLKYEPKRMIFKEMGFESFEDMIIKNWNDVVTDDDIVIHVGDVFLSVGRYLTEYKIKSSRTEYMVNFVNKLNGKKYLILGNHDYRYSDKLFKKMGFKEIYDYLILENFLVTHYPLVIHSYQSEQEKEWINELKKIYEDNNLKFVIHGHTHSKNVGLDNHFNVSVENINFKPVEFDKIKEILYN